MSGGLIVGIVMIIGFVIGATIWSMQTLQITKFRYFEALRLVVPVVVSLLAGSSALAGELGTLTFVARDFMNAAKVQAAILASHP